MKVANVAEYLVVYLLFSIKDPFFPLRLDGIYQFQYTPIVGDIVYFIKLLLEKNSKYFHKKRRDEVRLVFIN